MFLPIPARISIVAVLAAGPCSDALARPASSESDAQALKRLEPFLESHCLECHDDASSKGDLDLSSLAFEPSKHGNFALWERVFDRVRDGEMPPKKKPRPAENEKNNFLSALKSPLLATDRAEVLAKGRVRGRRLTRVEYENTLHDLLGIDIPLADRLPADETGDEFETVAEVQQLSHFHLDNYLEAADAALEEAFDRAMRGDDEYRRSYGPKELTAEGGGNYRGPETRNGKVRTWPLTLQFFGRMPATRVPEPGWYRITIKNLRAINAGSDGVVWGTLRTGAGSSDAPVLYYVASVEATEKPRDHRYEAWIREDHLIEFKPNEGTNRTAPSGAKGGNVSFKGRDLEKDGFAGMEFDGIEVERIYPNATQAQMREKLLPGIALEKGKPVTPDPEGALERLVADFAERAFRRPASEAQVAPYLKLPSAKLKESGQMREALHVGYRAILCSPRFLTFVEAPGRLDDYAVASRLSYLFWDSMPDRELIALADRGELGKRNVLEAQVKRLLADDKADRFIASFTDQWLNLKEIDFTSPDGRRFREFDPIVQDSMVRETRGFLRELIRDDLGVSHFIQSDFAMLNTRLKNHYSLKDAEVIPGKGLQRVSLDKTYRGGLVTQGSILKVTADGSVTSPVLRGVWVNERILGMHVPPPPPNVPAVEPDIRGATSIRDQLEKHRSDVSCAACHAKIDPAGFALESFDPVGQWRTSYGTSRDAAKVNPGGVTPEGDAFADIGEWKEIYHAQPELLARAFARHFLTYATGAAMRFSDRETIDRIVAEVKSDDYGVRSIMQAAVASDIFLNK